MNNLIVVGACYLDTILRHVTLRPNIGYSSIQITPRLQSPVSHSFHPRTPSCVPPASTSAEGGIVPTHWRSWSSCFPAMMLSDCIWCHLCRAPRPRRPDESSLPLAQTLVSALIIAYTASKVPRPQAATLSEARLPAVAHSSTITTYPR